MKKLILIAILIITTFKFHAQEFAKQGAIKTPKGILIYFNNDAESYTLNLEGKIDIKQYPLIMIDSKAFQLNKGPKKTFGNDTQTILTNYQNWEQDYLEKEVFKQKIIVTQKTFSKNNILFDFWHIRMPKSRRTTFPVVKTYYLDFVHNETVYGLTYSSMLGDDEEAKKFLLGIYESMHFYDQSLEIKKL
jgi:hypothetical protein